MLDTSRSGLLTHCLIKRVPIGVTVRSRMPSSDPEIVPERIVSVNSRFLRVAASRVMNSSRLYRLRLVRSLSASVRFPSKYWSIAPAALMA